MAVNIISGFKIGSSDALDYRYGSFSSVNEANTIIPIQERYIGLQVYIIIAGEGKLFIYKSGINDIDLVEFSGGISPSDQYKLDRLNFTSSRIININDELDLISTKVDTIPGKGLSSNDFTDLLLNNLNNQSGINTGDQILPTKLSLGLENVDNTSDNLKPVSIAQGNALILKQDKIAGKGLSTNDYDNLSKDYLDLLKLGFEVDVLGNIKLLNYPITRSDGELLTNKILSMDELGNLGLYNITIFSSPYVDVNSIQNFSPNVQYNWNLVGDFFTYDTVVTMTGGTISYTEFVNSKLMIVHFTSSATAGYYNLTLNNGITKIFTNYIHITIGTIYPTNINSWANVTNATIDESGNVLESTSTLSAHAELIQQQDYLKDFEVTFSLALSPYYPVFNGLNHQSFIGLYDSVTDEHIINMMFDNGLNPANPYIYGRATASYSQQSTPDADYSTIWRFRWLTGVLTVYRDNTLQLTTNEVITANTKLVLNLKGVDVDQVSYIEL